MTRDNDKPKVDDESSSKSGDSLLGRGDQEGIGSVSSTRGSKYFEEGSSSSSSHNHMNNLEEHQRLMMLRINQGMRHLQHTDDPNSTKKAPVYPPGSRFLPTDLGCVRVHLRNKVDKKKSGFITTLDVYKDDPWLLDHVENDLFPRGEWYYFTPRNKRGASSCSRTVRGRGGGGTWKTISVKEAIKDKDKKVEGYIQSLVYNKTNVNGEIKPTGWTMKEYCLHEKNEDDLVLCHLKGDLKKKGFAEEVKKDNILSNQVQDHEQEEAGANRVEMRTLQEDHGDATQQQQQQQQQQEQDAPVRRSLEGQGLGLETMMTTHNNLMTMVHEEDHGDATQEQQQQQEQGAAALGLPSHEGEDIWSETNNLMTMQHDEDHGDDITELEQQRLDQDYPLPDMPHYEGQYSGFETMRQMQNDFRTMLQINHGDSSTQQQQEQDAMALDITPLHENHELGFETMTTTHNNLTTVQHEEDHGDATQKQQQQEQDAPVPALHHTHEGQDLWFETMMPTLDEDRQNDFDGSDFFIDVDEVIKDNANEAHLQQPDVSQARDMQ